MQKKKGIGTVIVLTLIFTGVWYLLSGMFDLLHFGSGVVAAFIIAWSIQPVADSTRFRLLPFLKFVPWLIWQIIVSNLRVARIVLSREMPAATIFIRQHPGVTGDRALTLLAASNTLTPGTLTVEVGEGEFFVHALDEGFAQGVSDGDMAARVREIFTTESA